MRLREIRRTKNMSGVKVAEYLGISPQYYYDLERGERNLSSELAVKLSELFNSTIDYLLGITENNLYSLSLYNNGGTEMYKVKIRETWVQERSEGDHSRRRVEFIYETELPFVPVIGMHWEDETKAINLPVNNLTWSGDYNIFVIKHHVNMASAEEIDNFIETAKSIGWEVIER